MEDALRERSFHEIVGSFIYFNGFIEICAGWDELVGLLGEQVRHKFGFAEWIHRYNEGLSCLCFCFTQKS